MNRSVRITAFSGRGSVETTTTNSATSPARLVVVPKRRHPHGRRGHLRVVRDGD